MELIIRQNNRLFGFQSPSSYDVLLCGNDKFRCKSGFEDLIEILLDDESSIESKTDCLINLNNNIQLSPKLFKFYLDLDFINSIFSLASVQPHICCLVYKFFYNLMKNFSRDFYSIFTDLDIYKNTISNFSPSLDHFAYHHILLFICETIQQVPDSIQYLVECGLLDQLSNMDENENIDQVLFIYSNVLSLNEENDYSSISNIFNYLSKSKITTIGNALYYIHKCLQKQDSDYIWKYAIFDERLSFLMETFNVHIVSNVIYCYTLICNFGEEPISMLIDEKNILKKIFHFIFDTIEQALSDSSNRQILIDSHVATSAALEFFFSMVSNAENGEIIAEIYKLFLEFDFPNTINIFNFQCKDKICQIALSLLCKIDHNQAVDLFTADFLDSIALILESDNEKIEYFDLVLNLAKERFAVDNQFIGLISDIQSNYCSNY